MGMGSRADQVLRLSDSARIGRLLQLLKCCICPDMSVRHVSSFEFLARL